MITQLQKQVADLVTLAEKIRNDEISRVLSKMTNLPIVFQSFFCFQMNGMSFELQDNNNFFRIITCNGVKINLNKDGRVYLPEGANCEILARELEHLQLCRERLINVLNMHDEYFAVIRHYSKFNPDYWLMRHNYIIAMRELKHLPKEMRQLLWKHCQ